MAQGEARFSVGQVVQHLRFGYRGVIVDVDPVFSLSDEWYEEMARTRPPRDRPWYHVLVHEADHLTYVAERNLEADLEGTPISHPLLDQYFSGFANGRYMAGYSVN